MTIFLHVAKQFIKKILDDQCESSQQKDALTKNFLLIYTRNSELSGIKRERIRALNLAIHEQVAGRNDQDNANQLMTKVKNCLTELGGISTKAVYLAGSSEATLNTIIHFIESLQTKAIQYQLIDQELLTQEGELTAFPLFLQACTLYFARRIVDEPQPQALERIIYNPNLTALNNFYLELDAVIEEKLDLIWSIIAGLTREEDHSALKNKMAEVFMNDLISHHQSIHQRYAWSPGKLLFPTYLEHYLNDALTILRNATHPSYSP
jgi:hypothetical protein